MGKGSSDYGFHGYDELCNFNHCLLLKTNELPVLPRAHEWERYMGLDNGFHLSVDQVDAFSADYEIGRELTAGRASEVRDIRVHCREFIGRQIVLILESAGMSSTVQWFIQLLPRNTARGRWLRCVQFVLSELCRILVSSGVVSLDESRSAVEEYTSYVVDTQRQHAETERNASYVIDEVDFILRGFSFLAPPSVASFQAMLFNCRYPGVCVLLSLWI